jgi:putative DNA methylase
VIEKAFDVAFVAQMAQREKQIQQNYRPVIGVHKWFARRPGTLFRALLLSEFDSAEALQTSFFRGHDFQDLTIADPFMGGG